jgi:hypothetical protein
MQNGVVQMRRCKRMHKSGSLHAHVDSSGPRTTCLIPASEFLCICPYFPNILSSLQQMPSGTHLYPKARCSTEMPCLLSTVRRGSEHFQHFQACFGTSVPHSICFPLSQKVLLVIGSFSHLNFVGIPWQLLHLPRRRRQHLRLKSRRSRPCFAAAFQVRQIVLFVRPRPRI